ncbi:MAG TPA: EamA family transporter [Phenylobacterium sp.]
MKLADMALCAGFSLALPVGQTLFKFAADHNAKMTGPLVMRLATNPPLIGAFAWYGLTALFWFYILTRVPLSTAYVFSILGSGLVPLIAWLVFKEPLDWRFPIGYLLMLTGFAVIMTGQRAGAG